MSATSEPVSMSVEALAEWLGALRCLGPDYTNRKQARAVLALVERKVREAVCAADRSDTLDEALADEIVAKVMGEVDAH